MYFPLNKDEKPDSVLLYEGERLADQTPVFGGNTYAALHDAFELVRSSDWKDPINAEIRESTADVVFHAIVFFTATELLFFRPPHDPETILVYSEGYRLGPAVP